MSDVSTLKSYLVGLGFSVDQQQYKKFESTLADAARSVSKETAAIGGSILKWQAGIVGMFVAVSGAVLSMMDKVSMADQEYRLFGERMFMSTNQARSMKVALDALGASIEEVAFDPELHERFMQLQKDQEKMYKTLGMGSFEDAAKGVRDITFELSRFKVELSVLQMGLTKELFKGVFGDGDVLKKLREWNDYLINHIPQLSKMFATVLTPIMRDTWRVIKDVVEVLGVLATGFTNIVALFSGDDSISSTTFSFEKFATAIDKVVRGISSVLEFVLKLEQHLPILGILGGASTGAVVGSFIPGVGTAAGAVAGGVAGGILDLMGRRGGAGGQSAANRGSGASGDMIDAARQLAKRIGAETNSDPSLIFAQFAHETGNFTHMGGSNNLAGVMTGNKYRNYDSLDAFGDDYEKVLSNKRYTGIFQTNTPESRAHLLKKDGYYADLEANYVRGMKAFQPEYYGGGGNKSTSISVGDIHINQPGADVHEIKNAVMDAVDKAAEKQTQRNLAELTPVWQ